MGISWNCRLLPAWLLRKNLGFSLIPFIPNPNRAGSVPNYLWPELLQDIPKFQGSWRRERRSRSFPQTSPSGCGIPGIQVIPAPPDPP